jgi:hypothetical protein
MDRKNLEASCTYLAVIVLAILVMLSILGVADGIFNWDILPPALDKIAMLIMGSLAIILGACVLVSVMLNVSIIAGKISKIADREKTDD